MKCSADLECHQLSPDLYNVFRTDASAVTVLHAFAPLFFACVGLYGSPAVLRICLISSLRRTFKASLSLNVVCVCVFT